MKHKVSELKGPLLDAAVAKAEGRAFKIIDYGTPDLPERVCRTPDGRGIDWWPSSHWHQGGPIIERENMAVCRDDEIDPHWVAGWQTSSDEGDEPQPGFRRVAAEFWVGGPTPLIAAMRAYVASKFGEEIELP